MKKFLEWMEQAVMPTNPAVARTQQAMGQPVTQPGQAPGQPAAQPGQPASGTLDMSKWTDLVKQNAPGQNPQVSTLNQSVEINSPAYVVNGKHYPQTAEGAMAAASALSGQQQQ